MNISISVGNLDAIARGLREAPEVTDRELRAAMTEATALVWNQWSDNMPTVTSGTKQAITVDVFSTPAGVLGVVGNAQPSALFVELGTKPHFIGKEGREALAEWAIKKLGVSKEEAKGVAFAIGHKIARDGTPAQRPLGRAVDSTRGQIVVMFENAAQRIVQHLNGGAA